MSDQQFRPAHSAFDESPEVKEAAALSLAGKRLDRAAAEALVGPFLPEAARRESLPLIFYMFTDMKTQSTDLMFYGHNAEEIIRDAFHVEPEGNIAKLPGVVSRKKQLIPPLLAALQARQ